MATLYSSFRTAGGIGCDLLCENGNLLFSRARDMSQRLNVEMNGKKSKEYSLLPDGMGYQFEATEVMKCLDEGKLQSEIVPHSFSLDLMKYILTESEAKLGLSFRVECFRIPSPIHI